MTFSVFMYHALYSNDSELELIPAEERPYSVSVSDFIEQLDFLVENKISVIEPEVFLGADYVESKLNSVLITFDDGHSSFYKYAFPELQKRNLKAIFFITSDLIMIRNDFCSWNELKEMSNNGMCVQSHGKTHKFISELSDSESKFELIESKLEIERNVNNTVSSISFPGGRFSTRDCVAAQNIGYKFLFTSIEGVNSYKQCCNSGMVKRFALKGTTNINTFGYLSIANKYVIRKRILISSIKLLVKKIIGNEVYHFIYKRRQS